jgi:signal transduction histidine kinase
MTISIRARLLLGVIGGMAILLAASALVVYAVMYRSLLDGYDEVLASTARTICGSIEQDGEQIKLEIDEHEMPEFFRTGRPDYFQLWQEDGKTVERSPSLQGTDLVQFEGPLDVHVFRPIRLPDGRMGRAVGLLFFPKIDDEVQVRIQPRRARLVVARETASLDSIIRFLRFVLVATTGGTVVLALLVGAIVVRQGLRPLDALAAGIAAIRHDELSRRVPTNDLPAEMVPVVQRLNDLLVRLEEAFHRERAFTSDAAHELRTPLAGLRSTLEVALARPRGVEDYKECMTDCLSIIGHMQAMADTLLALARLEGGQKTLRPEAIRLAGLFEDIWRPFADRVRERGIADVWHVPPELVCTSDRDILIMIVTNLLANAAVYTNDGGRIEVTAGQAGASIELKFANTGSRLSDEDARHVFDRFWRGDASRTDTGIHGGLGLALVRRAVALLGGKVDASVGGDVFTVRVTLPAC